MKSTTNKLTIFTLGLLLSCPWQTVMPVQAQSLQERRAMQQKALKLAPDLVALLANDEEEQRQAMHGKTLAQVRQERRAQQQAGAKAEVQSQRTRIGRLLLPSPDVLAEEKQSFIVRVNQQLPAAVWQEKLAALGGQIKQRYEQSGLLTIEAPRTVIRQIAAQNEVAYISPDRPVQSSGHLIATAGAAQMRRPTSTNTNTSSSSTTSPTYDGKGIGVVVIDSGVDTEHILLTKWSKDSGIVEKLSFVTDLNGSLDPFGHGTHVASMLVGGSSYSSDYYAGIAPGAKLYSLRALNDQGQGNVSSVIAALDWCVANRTAKNIRVINLSLGAIAKDSYRDDPLCLAARRAVNAGIVVVAAAGNDGKDAYGNKIYGAIHSPGIDPSVITVGAANTYGTDARADDTIASYSSRGPTRGYTTDAHGVRHYDNLIKPDLVAPGNKIIGAASKGLGGGTAKYNNLLQAFPALNASFKLADVDGLRVMYLSGTSVAAPIVAGAAALLLQVNPNLTPNLVKAILTYTAQPLKGFNMFEQGAGELNIDGAMRIAQIVEPTLPEERGEDLLTKSLPEQSSTIATHKFPWGRGVITNWGFLYGNNLMTKWQRVYTPGTLLADATIYANGTLVKTSKQLSSGVQFFPGAVSINSSGIALADGIMMADGIALADGMLLSDGIALADGMLLSDGIALADGIMVADGTVKAGTAFLGDNTACMQPAN